MAKPTKEDQLVLSIQHLAGELYDLCRTKGPGAAITDAELIHQRQELADTLTSHMLALGPMRNERGNYFKACGNRLFEYLEVDPAVHHYHSLHGPGRELPYGWLYALSRAESCAAAEYEQAATQAMFYGEAEPVDTRQAQARWHRAEQQLVGEGLLPLSPKRPSAVGGARFITEICLSDDYLPAFRKAMYFDVDGFIESVRPSGFAQHLNFYTISVRDVNDLFMVAQFMVLQYFADKTEGRAGRC